MNNKYVNGYYENQVRLLQATGGQTPHFRFRFTVPVSFSGVYSGTYTDYINIALPSDSPTQPFRTVNSMTNLFCNLLPATSL